MEFISTSENFHRRNSYYGQNSSIILTKSQSINVPTPKPNDDILPINNFTYRTEIYLQQREKEHIDKSPLATKTTWKNLKHQKQIVDDEQAEIDRVLSTIDSIHGTFNRSLSIPHNQVYSSLYANDNKSDRLMKTFCQCQNHYMSYEVSMKDDNDDDDYDEGSKTQVMSYSFGTDLDDDTDDEEENENEKKNSYDSGYGSVMPKRQFSREPLLKIAQTLKIN